MALRHNKKPKQPFRLKYFSTAAIQNLVCIALQQISVITQKGPGSQGKVCVGARPLPNTPCQEQRVGEGATLWEGGGQADY